MAVIETLNIPDFKSKGDAKDVKRYEEPFSSHDDPDWGMEDVEGYRSGTDGFHPVDIGDTFKNERYKILHKLGSGGYATVWLARDHLNRRYLALRISRASAKYCTPDVDLKLLAYLQDKISTVGGPGSEFIDIPLDSFHIQGLNGRHHCLVSKPAGPRLWAACRKMDEGKTKKAADFGKGYMRDIYKLHISTGPERCYTRHVH
jgi:hypothetical protein